MTITAASETSTGPDGPVTSGPWTDAEINLLIELWPQNLSNLEISHRIGRRENAVAIKASRLKLPPKAIASVQFGVGKTTRNPKARVRPCLCCQRQFFSEGSGNRICDTCKSSRSWSDGYDYAVRMSGGR